jgi:hypothetical protein
MKTATISRTDNLVYIDGVAVPVDCSDIDPAVHVIQWNDETQRGAIEFVDTDPNDGFKEPNQLIDDISAWQSYIDTAATMIREAATAEE